MSKGGQIAILESVHPLLNERFVAAGYEVIDATQVSRAAILDGALMHAIGLIVRSRFIVDAELLNALPALRFLGRSGSGLENIDMAACEAARVAVFNSPEGNADAVGEHVVGMMLTLLHKLREADSSVRSGEWARELHRGRELGALTVGLIGFGHMGRAVAQRLTGFGCRVLAYDKYKPGFHGLHNVEEVDEQTLLNTAHIVSLHVPLTAETEGMVNAAWLRQLGADAPLLINAARGPIVVTADVHHALEAGNLEGVGLDVLQEEGRDLLGLRNRPDALHALMQHPRTLFSPHVAGWTQESYEKLATVLVEKILDHESGA